MTRIMPGGDTKTRIWTEDEKCRKPLQVKEKVCGLYIPKKPQNTWERGAGES